MTDLQKLTQQKSYFIFDFDGTLVDLEELNISCFREAFYEVHGITMTEKDYVNLIAGSGAKGGTKQYLEAKNLDIATYDEIVKRMRGKKDSKMKGNVRDYVFVKPGVNEYLEYLYSKNIPMAVGTSSLHRYVDAAKSEFGWNNYFPIVVTAEDVKHTKPDPEIFIKTMEKLGGQKNNTIIFEDSGNGIEAARRSGMDYIALHTPGYNDKFIADETHVINDYRELITKS